LNVRSLKDKQTTIEQLQASVDSMKRDGKTLEGLKLKLSDKVKDNLNLVCLPDLGICYHLIKLFLAS